MPTEGLAHQQDGEPGPEDRHEVDEETSPVRADQLDAAHEGELRDERRPQRHEQHDGPALRRRPDRVAQRPFGVERRQGCHEGRERHRGEEAQARDLGPARERHGVTGIEQAGGQHQHVAPVEGEGGEHPPVAVGRRHHGARERHGDAQHLRARHRHPEDDVVDQDDENRDRPLEQGDVDAAGEQPGGVEQAGVEGVAAGPHQQHVAPVPLQAVPLRHEARPRRQRQSEAGEGPAQAGEDLGRDLARRPLARHHVAAPEQHREHEERVGRGHRRGRASGGRLRDAHGADLPGLAGSEAGRCGRG
ncbi:hypothetical protein CFIICLFH_0445 [Methylobacterium goesingense]|nr:hypothetical protein CFIICLFH_0445 [Methylobacterium goesingense]